MESLKIVIEFGDIEVKIEIFREQLKSMYGYKCPIGRHRVIAHKSTVEGNYFRIGMHANMHS